jgi:hypothetical protein
LNVRENERILKRGEYDMISRCKILPGKSLLFVLGAFLASISLELRADNGQIDILPTGSETFVISDPGSYVLVDNVAMSADVNGISISCHDVTLDLGGHAISGTGKGTTFGIIGVSAERVHILNGEIKSFTADGIRLDTDAQITNVIVKENQGNGIRVSTGAHISGVTAASNGANGILTSHHSIVENCVARLNAAVGDFAGIWVEDNCIVKNCSCEGNSNTTNNGNVNSYGIKAGKDCVIEGNTCKGNSNSTTDSGGAACGINTTSGSTIKHNTCMENNGSNEGTDAYGIYCWNACTVIGNTCSGNEASGENGASFGIFTNDYCLIAGNTCSLNQATHVSGYTGTGISVGSDSLVRDNVCAQNNGVWSSTGILVRDSRTRVENNACNLHTKATTNLGISVESLGSCNVLRNTTRGNATAAISMGNSAHYCAENICQEETGIINTTGCTMGTNDRSNVIFTY